MNASRVSAAKKLMNRITQNTGKKWPNLNNAVFGKGTNGLIFRTRNNPNKLVKITLGNASREVNTMKKMQNSGFVPKLNGNFVSIRKLNNNLKQNLFPNFYFNSPGEGSPPNTPGTAEKKKFLSAYVMNKVGNATLWQYVKRSRPTNNMKREIRKAVRDAIVFMHQRGISHGDLHSANILVELDAAGKMKKIWVIDFGRSVNIPVGKTEANAYQALRVNRNYTNYNLFNNSKKPIVKLYNMGKGLARKNENLYKTMYGGNLNNLK